MGRKIILSESELISLIERVVGEQKTNLAEKTELDTRRNIKRLRKMVLKISSMIGVVKGGFKDG